MTCNATESLLSLDALLKAVNGFVVLNKNTENFYFNSVTTDSRNVKDGSLFVPLVGEKQDGHIYVPESVKKGASVVFINKSEYEKKSVIYDRLVSENTKVCIVAVENTLTALQKAAERYVEQFPSLIKVAVTGSSGKTTTKEMVVSVLKQKYNVVYTQGNFNSETGLPLSVFNIRKEHECGVFEMGMNRENEIGEIASVLKPEYAIISNIGSAHIGILKSRENIAREKRKVFDYISEKGCAFIPEKDDFRDFLGQNVKGEIVYYGDSLPDGTGGVHFIKDNGLGGTVFSLDGVEISLKMPGKYNYCNALSACALARKLGLTAEQIKTGLEGIENIGGRMETSEIVLRGNTTVTLIKDCYNANYESMTSVLKFCDSIRGSGKKIYVLGDMLELGEKSEEIHRKIGKYVSETMPDYVIFIGEQMKLAAIEAEENGYGSLCIPYCSEEAMLFASSFIIDCAEEGDIILLKGSRGMAMERIIPFISARETEKEGK